MGPLVAHILSLPSSSEFVFDSIENAVEAFKRGEFVVVMDDETRENEGDLLLAAEFVTPEKVCLPLFYRRPLVKNEIKGMHCKHAL